MMCSLGTRPMVWYRDYHTMKELVGVGVCVVVATSVLYLAASTLSREVRDGRPLSFPTTLEDLRTLAEQLHSLKQEHFYGVLGLFSLAYLYKQTFAIPGSLFLNVLAGALFGVWWGVPLVCILTACGASACYLLSWAFGRRIVETYLSHRIAPLRQRLAGDHPSLLLAMISLRLFPMSPNWLLNIASPLLGVPLPLFFTSVLLGLLPYNFLGVQAGLLLRDLQLLQVLDVRWTVFLLLAAGALMTITLTIGRYRRTKSI